MSQLYTLLYQDLCIMNGWTLLRQSAKAQVGIVKIYISHYYTRLLTFLLYLLWWFSITLPMFLAINYLMNH